MKVLTIALPVYNEADNITTALMRIAEEVSVPYTITIVYDTDLDTTVPVVREWQNSHDNVVLLKNKYGRGVLNAIKTGLEESQTEYIVVTMADLSYNATHTLSQRFGFLQYHTFR
ncbi:MAG: hypothetical protein Ta2F_19010 [Termitinemataceae bacterium]|nr:MAG: hypothetical protein Ta2F_19010 [Termitinemataceae bacterium]